MNPVRIIAMLEATEWTGTGPLAFTRTVGDTTDTIWVPEPGPFGPVLRATREVSGATVAKAEIIGHIKQWEDLLRAGDPGAAWDNLEQGEWFVKAKAKRAFSMADLAGMTPAIRIMKRVYTGGHHLDAVAEYVSTRVLTSWQKESPDREELVQEWIETHWPDLVDSGEGEEGFLLPGSSEFLSRKEMFRKIPATLRRKLGISTPSDVSSEKLGVDAY